MGLGLTWLHFRKLCMAATGLHQKLERFSKMLPATFPMSACCLDLKTKTPKTPSIGLHNLSDATRKSFIFLTACSHKALLNLSNLLVKRFHNWVVDIWERARTNHRIFNFDERIQLWWEKKWASCLGSKT